MVAKKSLHLTKDEFIAQCTFIKTELESYLITMC